MHNVCKADVMWVITINSPSPSTENASTRELLLAVRDALTSYQTHILNLEEDDEGDQEDQASSQALAVENLHVLLTFLYHTLKVPTYQPSISPLSMITQDRSPAGSYMRIYLNTNLDIPSLKIALLRADAGQVVQSLSVVVMTTSFLNCN